MNAEQKDVLMKVGAALVMVQTAEQLIRMCMTYVLQKGQPLTIETLEKQTNEERKKTLGYFLGELRKRADLDDDFDALLAQFLEDRNTLVHRLSDVPGLTLHTTEGRRIAAGFVERFIGEAVEVVNIFTGLVRAWQEQARIDVPLPAECEFFTEIDAKYKTRVDDLFFEKES